MRNEKPLEDRVAQLQRDLSLTGAGTDQRFLEMRADLDRLRLELIALKRFLASAYPSFSEEFPHYLERTVEEVDPEFN